jgi:hypothetical protein
MISVSLAFVLMPVFTGTLIIVLLLFIVRDIKYRTWFIVGNAFSIAGVASIFGIPDANKVQLALLITGLVFQTATLVMWVKGFVKLKHCENQS